MTTCAIFSFFSGAGFLDLGFEDSGFETVFANEISKEFSSVYMFSRKKLGKPELKYGVNVNSIDDYLFDENSKIFLRNAVNETRKTYDLVGFIGGPPCPDFSVAGKNKGATGENGRLSQSYVDLICQEKPDFFVFENVKGLWKTLRHRKFFDELLIQLEKNGYQTTANLINSLEYGVPQERERIILIGVQKKILESTHDDLQNFPWRKFIKYNIDEIKSCEWPTVSNFSEDSALDVPNHIIPELTVQYWFEKNDVLHHPNANDFFIPRSGLIKMKTYEEGDVSRKCYKRLHRYKYSPTAAYGNNEVHLHPYKARRLSVAETLAIQSLPKEYSLPDSLSLTAKFKTIGNGVPYLAAKGIAKTLKYFFDKKQGV